MSDSRGPRRQKVTLRHVADAAKVSKATASLALNNNPRISEATRKRVLAAVDSLGYVYNQRAASLRTQRSYTIGLIIKDVSNPFNAELTSGAESQLADHDYSLVLATTDDVLDKQSRLVKTMLERDVDGLILAPVADTTIESMQRLMQHCPLVLLIPYYPELAADCVGMEDESGTERAVARLIEQGHRRIAFVGGFAAQETRQRRLQSYRDTLQRNGIDFDPALCIDGPVTRRGGYDAIHELLRWRGRNVLFIIVIATMMLPFQVRMIPLYILFARIGWLNSFLPLIVPNFFGNAFYIFLMRQFMMTLPKELDDAARIDGASEWGIFWRVAVPLSKPAILTVAIFEIIHTWHDFIGPLVYLRHPTKYTLSIGLRLYFTQYGAEWGLLMAAAAMFTIPMVIFFFFAQRSFIEGITLTGLKG